MEKVLEKEKEEKKEFVYKMKLTEKKLKYLIKDERKAVKEYKSLGLPGLSRDEAKHMKFLKSKLKKLKGGL